MTIVQLEYITKLAEYGNFTVAAEKCFVTQPTLSMQIQKLEHELGVEIFDRSIQPVKVTEIGEKIIAQAKVILDETKKINDIISEEKGIITGDFTIGVIHTLSPTLVPLFYKTFQKKHPETNLIIKEMQTEQIIEDLEHGKIDFGLMVTPLHEKHLRETVLYYEPLVAYVPEKHELHSKRTISQNDLNPDDLLLLKEGHCFRNNVLNICESANLKNQSIRLDSGSLDALIKLSDDGYGMTLLPSLHAEDLPERFQRNLRNFSEPTPTREVSLVYHQSNMRKLFIDELTQIIQSVVRGKIFIEKMGEVTSPLISLPRRKRI